jgi:AP-1-like factor
MDPLTPNTSAFLSYLSGATGNANMDFSSTDQYNPFDSYTTFNANTKQPSSLPPSALFPVPGRDTPETTPPSSSETNPSPDKPSQAEATGNKASDSEEEAPKQSGTANASAKKATHKRKAGQGHHINEDADEDEDDTASDFTTGHDDKRSHQTKATGTKKGGRKSIGGEEGKGGKDPSKAAKRKEQNRAAQKAFRERREAKVKDVSAPCQIGGDCY